MAGVGVAGAGLLGVAQAQAPAPAQPVDVVAIRQATMALMHGAWRAITAGVQAKAEPKLFIQATRGIAGGAKVFPTLFPAGSGTGRLGFPAIYEDRAGFDKAAAALLAAADQANKAAVANDPEAFATAVKAVSEACGGCHPRRFADNWNK